MEELEGPGKIKILWKSLSVAVGEPKSHSFAKVVPFLNAVMFLVILDAFLHK